MSSICSGLEFWSVNLTSVCENSESKTFKNVNTWYDICNNWSVDLLGANSYKVYEASG